MSLISSDLKWVYAQVRTNIQLYTHTRSMSYKNGKNS